MKTVTVRQAQTHLPELLQLVAKGEEVRLVDEKKAVAKLVPVRDPAGAADWQTTWDRVDAVFHGQPAPGKAGSRIVAKVRRRAR